MLIKWTMTETSETDQKPFELLRSEWQLRRSIPGFLGQTGGWPDQTRVRAHVVSYWRDEYSLAAVKRELEAGADSQGGPKLKILRGHVINAINTADILTVLPRASFLRISDCQLIPDRSPIFLATQMSIWNQGMANAPGMLGATWARVESGKDHFISASFWADESAHDYYRQEIFPALDAKANTRQHLASLETFKIHLEPEWLIRP
jgi:heme-degrading monooxygenase HmoA